MEKENAEKLSITLPAEMVRLIRARVATGDYASNSDVIRDAMRAWAGREKKLAELDEKIMAGLADADAGRMHTADEVLQSLRQRFGK